MKRNLFSRSNFPLLIFFFAIYNLRLFFLFLHNFHFRHHTAPFLLQYFLWLNWPVKAFSHDEIQLFFCFLTFPTGVRATSAYFLVEGGRFLSSKQRTWWMFFAVRGPFKTLHSCFFFFYQPLSLCHLLFRLECRVRIIRFCVNTQKQVIGYGYSQWPENQIYQLREILMPHQKRFSVCLFCSAKKFLFQWYSIDQSRFWWFNHLVFHFKKRKQIRLLLHGIVAV